ncbi:hypothetical protein CCAX7_60610 [Capsulimonas corticalis]|uniref:Uncharacterized protein n=1 Tax=Capsulimonas corticalis TaxID=2219043 RepID=A0A402CW36_9BACT|nr:hypothetical protein [Capsulimonas corticalis]BDI34010.1 hypothetical protein CCAX7_60610 [Capsulimonas corticalis]
MPKSPTTSPARLYVILAREASVGVIFRQGPSDWTQIIHWDTATDTFTPGQWFHGDIQSRRSDLSPDGKLMIYHAVKDTWKTRRDTEYTHTWTAISKPPYLTALALWPLGENPGGGGMFQSNEEVVVHHPPSHMAAHEKHQSKGLRVTYTEPVMHGFGQVEFDGYGFARESQRFERDGWRQIQEWHGEHIPSPRQHAIGLMMMEVLEGRKVFGEPEYQEWYREAYGNLPVDDGSMHYVDYAPGIKEKQNSSQTSTLTITKTRGESLYSDGFPFLNVYSVRDNHGHEQQIEKAEWADWDQQGRLVYARDGKLFEFTLAGESIELAEFNDAKPEQMAAPEWAKTWDYSKKDEDRP